MSRREPWIEGDRGVEQAARFKVVLTRGVMEEIDTLQIAVIGIHIAGKRFGVGARVVWSQGHFQRGNDLVSHLVLQIEK